ncbi:MAG: hypothetical protein EON48_04700 [Acetobacteraceae bacterium]|nr:MAG: hypothetical protein EON48_04700 [Acetobacteraceae bacterium]
MTIDLRRWLIALPLVGAGWIGTLALVMRLGGEAPAALVMFPPEGLLRGLPADVAVVASGPVSVTLRGGADLVAALYALGAPLVLPAGLTGCLPQNG